MLLHASGWDLEQQYMPDTAFTWKSSLSGVIATGRKVLVSTLPVGTQTITLTGMDQEGMFINKTAIIQVTARTLLNPDTNGDNLVNGLDLSSVLGNWGGVGVGDVDLNGLVSGSDLTVIFSSWTG